MNDDLIERAALAAWCADDGDTPSTWAAETEATRVPWRTAVRAALVAAGVTTEREREARLAGYRCAAAAMLAGPLDVNFDGIARVEERARHIEDMAHAMLAAERPAVAPKGAGK